MAKQIFRIRKYCGRKGGSNYYYHADVIGYRSSTVLKAAQENRIKNWRWVDTFDVSKEDYCHYEVLYVLNKKEAKLPELPLPKKKK
jgi:hypothetical protein